MRAGRRRWRRPAPLLAAVTVAFALALLLLAAPAPTLAQTAGFPDVSKTIPAYDAIEFMTGAGVISGYTDGTFKPGNTLTRGQATKVLVLWRGLTPVTPSKPTFPDLDAVYRSYVETAAAQGWITGFSDGSFRPYSTLNRQQMATIMVRAMGWDADAKKLTSSQIQQTLGAFTDYATIAAGARPYVALAVQRGLFGGLSDGRFCPVDGITRAQFVLVAFRAELSLRAVVQQIRFSADHPDRTRVVLDLSRAASKVTASASPDGTLAVDFTEGAMGGVLTTTVGSAEVKTVTARQFAYDPRTVRVTLALGRYESFKVSTLAPAGDAGNRIVIDVFRRTDGPVGDGPPLICIDAGHGGTDPGALGVSGSKEKEVNLAIALLVADNLRKAGLAVMMTRDTDVFIPLQTRADMANAAGATLFVSIHNNAHTNADASGTETFYRGTPDDYCIEGRVLAECIQRKLIAELGARDRGAKTHWRELVVLNKTSMTAALTEVGFMTNAAEEAKLLDPTYQARAARAIADGILEYLEWSTSVTPGSASRG